MESSRSYREAIAGCALVLVLLGTTSSQADPTLPATARGAHALAEAPFNPFAAKAQPGGLPAAVADLSSEYQRTPLNAKARRFALVLKAGQLDTPEAIDFLLGVALAPMPPREAVVSSVAGPDCHSGDVMRFRREMVVRMAALDSLAALGLGGQRDQAHRALLTVVERAERPVRREAAIALLLSVPDSERAAKAAELKPLLPATDADVLSVQRRRSPEPGPALPERKAGTMAKAPSNTPAPIK